MSLLNDVYAPHRSALLPRPPNCRGCTSPQARLASASLGRPNATLPAGAAKGSSDLDQWRLRRTTTQADTMPTADHLDTGTQPTGHLDAGAQADPHAPTFTDTGDLWWDMARTGAFLGKDYEGSANDRRAVQDWLPATTSLIPRPERSTVSGSAAPRTWPGRRSSRRGVRATPGLPPTSGARCAFSALAFLSPDPR